MAPIQVSDWRMVAQQASQEMNSNKLTTLIDRLCQALDDDAPPTSHTPFARAVQPPSHNPADR
jgi:hypothetical protein